MTSGPNGTTLAYDPLGRLRNLVSGTTNRRFLYDGLDLIGEYDAAGARRIINVLYRRRRRQLRNFHFGCCRSAPFRR
jgi:hypothetical protein